MYDKITWWAFLLIIMVHGVFGQTDYYDVLGIHRSSDIDQIKRAFRMKVKTIHPDKNENEDAVQNFHDLREAYETLTQTQKRIKFDNECQNCGKTWYESLTTTISKFRSPLQILKDCFRKVSHFFMGGLNTVAGVLDSILFPQYTCHFPQLNFVRPISRPGECNCKEEIIIKYIGNGIYQMTSQFICNKCDE